MLTDIHMKFHEDSLNGFQVIEQTQFCDRYTDTGGGGGGGGNNMSPYPKGVGGGHNNSKGINP